MSEWKTSERKQFNILCGNAQLLECPQCGTLSVVDFAYCPGVVNICISLKTGVLKCVLIQISDNMLV